MEIKSLICILFSGVSVFMDLKTEKVSNIWIIIGCMISLLMQMFGSEETTLWKWLQGMFFPMVVLFPLFLGKMIGTGDIKVFMVLGSILGWKKIFQCMLSSFFIGALISIPIIVIRCNIYNRFSYFISYVVSVTKTRKIQPYLATGKRPENIHFTIPIFFSVLCLIMKGGSL